MQTFAIIFSISIVTFCVFMIRELLYKEHPFDFNLRSGKAKGKKQD